MQRKNATDYRYFSCPNYRNPAITALKWHLRSKWWYVWSNGKMLTFCSCNIAVPWSTLTQLALVIQVLWSELLRGWVPEGIEFFVDVFDTHNPKYQFSSELSRRFHATNLCLEFWLFSSAAFDVQVFHFLCLRSVILTSLFVLDVNPTPGKQKIYKVMQWRHNLVTGIHILYVTVNVWFHNKSLIYDISAIVIRLASWTKAIYNRVWCLRTSFQCL